MQTPQGAVTDRALEIMQAVISGALLSVRERVFCYNDLYKKIIFFGRDHLPFPHI